MPNSVPTVGGTPSYVIVTFRYIDANGTKDSFSVRTTLARATDAVVEGMVAALGVASNANVYETNKQLIYSAGNATPTLAVEEPRESAKDVIETLHRDPASGKSQYAIIPAPIDSMFIPLTNTVDTENTDFAAVEAAMTLLLPATYNVISTRFAQHKETAEKVDR